MQRGIFSTNRIILVSCKGIEILESLKPGRHLTTEKCLAVMWSNCHAVLRSSVEKLIYKLNRMTFRLRTVRQKDALSEVEWWLVVPSSLIYQIYLSLVNIGLVQGDFINRLINGILKPNIKIVGSDIAGRIEAVGKNIKKFQPGDEVYGDLSGRWGGFAEYVCARENVLASKPAGMSFGQAAAIPQAAMHAIQGLRDSYNCGT
jgi:hypothetical protein